MELAMSKKGKEKVWILTNSPSEAKEGASLTTREVPIRGSSPKAPRNSSSSPKKGNESPSHSSNGKNGAKALEFGRTRAQVVQSLR